MVNYRYEKESEPQKSSNMDYCSADACNICSVNVEKIYFVNIIFQFQHDSDVEYHHFRITMTRDGVLRIDEI